MPEVFGPLLNARVPCGNLWMSMFSFSLNPNTIHPRPLESICMGEKCVWALLLVHILMFELSFEEVIVFDFAQREWECIWPQFGTVPDVYIPPRATSTYVLISLKIQTSTPCVCWLAHLCFTLLVTLVLWFKPKKAPFMNMYSIQY